MNKYDLKYSITAVVKGIFWDRIVVYEAMGSCGCVRGDGIVWLCTRRWDRVVVNEVM